MTGPKRRTVLLGGVAAIAAAGTRPNLANAAVAGPVTWVGAGTFQHVYDPTPNPPYQYLNDHCVIRGNDGTWHLYGIIGDSAPPGGFPDGGQEIQFAHATAPALTGPWTTRPPALSIDRNYFGEVHLWAPHVVESNGTYYLYYAAGGANCAINLATSTDLYTWTRIPTGPVFRGLVARDPYVTRVGSQWVMYYCELADWQSNHTVACRTSTDLLHWSAPHTVFTDPTTDATASVTESPVVIQRDGWWYLFIGPRGGYVGTDVYRSTDPMNFRLQDYAGHVPAHAVEVLEVDGNWWATAAGSFQHGIYAAPLEWRSTAPVWHSPDNPAAGLNPQGQLELFALDSSGRIVRRVQNGNWGDWEVFSDQVATVPTVGRNTDGRLELFTVGGGGLLHRAQRADGSWADWETFGGPTGAAPTVARNADGRLEVFALGPAGAYLTHRWQNAKGSPDWSDWENFGGAAGAPPVVGTNADGRLEVFAIGPAGAYLAHRWQNVASGDWHDWDTTFGGACAGLSRVDRDGRDLLNVFALAPVGTGVHRRTQAAPSGGWSNWQQAEPWSDTAARTAVNVDGRLEEFCIPPGGAQITHRWQTTPTSGTWSNSEVFDSQPVACAPTLIVDATGRQHVFAVSPAGVLRERVQLAPNSGWGPWQTLPGAPIAALPVGQPT